ncbi:MAG: M4 family metallopeptidase, partial [Vicinamibacteraceae bacterium]
FWVEGDPFPTSSPEANNMLAASKETYNFFLDAFGRDSFDGAGAVMDSIFNRGYGCPNASWNGVFISFCPGFTTDDVTAHEWGHAYTQYTHNLIYQWQPGALNEAYSDIWGEVVDLLNERGTDEQSVRRDTGCSEFQIFPPKVTVNSPEAIAGDYPAAGAAFGPVVDEAITGDVVLVSDGQGASSTDACEPITNTDAIAGNIALIDRGTCDFVVKVRNAQGAGASAAIVANNLDDALIFMGGADPTITIPSVFVGLTTGQQLKTHVGDGVNVTLQPEPPSPILDSSVRWLMGEDLGGLPGTGGIRDMWTPTCMGQPAKVSDAEYFCQEADAGGVHFNSGIPNHAFALLVDGGTYNDRTVAPIGLVKAAHLYYRAQTVYQVPTTNFADHADALDAACTDLIGEQLTDLKTGAPVPEMLTSADCEHVAKAMAAVEMRQEPVQCNFQPILAKDPPSLCGPDTTQVDIFSDDFEQDPKRRWRVSHAGATPADFTKRDWEWTSEIPEGREGSAFFAVDFQGGTCAPGGDESGVLHLQSPTIRIPSGVADPLVTFDHWIGSEEGWDGGNVKVSVNGGPWQVVAPEAFTFNAYNRSLEPVAEGNTNPMAGQPAWTGADEGGFTGSWGRSHLRLAGYAAPGDTVRLRFDFGTDGCTGTFGWYVDDVAVRACTSSALPTVDVTDAGREEGTRGLTPAKFTVKLSHAYEAPVIVRYGIVDGTAKARHDYLSLDRIFPFVVVPRLSISANVPLALIGAHVPEPNETFSIVLKDAENGVFGKESAVFTIIDDDGPAVTENGNGPTERRAQPQGNTGTAPVASQRPSISTDVVQKRGPSPRSSIR